MKKYFLEKINETRKPKLNKIVKSSLSSKQQEITQKNEPTMLIDHNEDNDDWDKIPSVSLNKKFGHDWIEETKAITKWQDKKIKLEEIIHFIKINVNIDGKDLFDVCAFVKLMINDSTSMISTTSITVAGYLSKGVRKGFRNYCKSDFTQLLLTKLRDKKNLAEALNSLNMFLI